VPAWTQHNANHIIAKQIIGSRLGNMPQFSIYEVPEDAPSSLEQLGSKKKFWYEDNKILFKEGYSGSGEHWSEVVASRICDLLSLPAAGYEFARYKGNIGVITKTIVPDGGRLIHGNELLSKFNDNSYDKEKTFKNISYTVKAVVTVHRMIQLFSPRLPRHWGRHDNISNPLDMFIGYIMLDALIANQDRHHENWGYIITGNELTLAPTFDHASSMGRSESDTTRNEKLTTRDKRGDLDQYAQRAKSSFYTTEQPERLIGTVDAFIEFAKYSKAAASFWRTKLDAITEDSLNSIFSDIPDGLISPIAAEFAIRLILNNKSRLIACRI
jgi:hypothetical protein